MKMGGCYSIDGRDKRDETSGGNIKEHGGSLHSGVDRPSLRKKRRRLLASINLSPRF